MRVLVVEDEPRLARNIKRGLESLPSMVVVLAGQITLAPSALEAAGIDAAHSVTEFAGSVQLAMDDAANQLTGLARRTAADWVEQVPEPARE